MIESIPTPLVSFAGSGIAGFFMGLFLRRLLKFLVIIIGSFLGAVFLVIQWMQAHQYIQGQVDWNRVGNDTVAWFQSLSVQVSSSHIFGTLGIPSEGFRAIDPVIQEILRYALKEIHIMAFVFTPRAMHILDLVEKAPERGVKITLVIDRLEDQDPRISNRLLALHDTYPNYVRITNFSNPEDRRLHAKLIVVDRRTAVLGSANLSWAGMTSNYEIAMRVDGSTTWKLASLVGYLRQIFFTNK
jgi:phosphatidylserine/phosphatidylglycerophosphate/cardiolipin synthase-like enzyme